jgi:hypothetical protein
MRLITTKIWVPIYITFSAVVLCYVVAPVFADPLKSSNYQFQETSIGGTGFANAASANFQGSGAAGIIGVGTSASSNFQIQAGHETTNDPALAFAILNPDVSFGAFSAGTTAIATATFGVVNYTSYGYIVQLAGSAPTHNGHALPGMSTTGPSQAGTEQFGINVVANTSPASFGANPDHGQFGVGSAATNYNTPNNYRFVNGETIASAPKSSGQTIYTVSYIANVNSISPAGQYTGDQTLICSGTY